LNKEVTVVVPTSLLRKTRLLYINNYNYMAQALVDGLQPFSTVKQLKLADGRRAGAARF
jgi:hypothetical protein